MCRSPEMNIAYEFNLTFLQCLACLLCFTRMFFAMGGKWSYSCFWDLFKTACSILVMFPLSFFPNVSAVVMIQVHFCWIPILDNWINTNPLVNSVSLFALVWQVTEIIHETNRKKTYSIYKVCVYLISK